MTLYILEAIRAIYLETILLKVLWKAAFVINSMTGYASSSVQAESLSLDFELKSVNSKSLDIKIYLPDYLSVLEGELRQFILKNISRGSILFKI